MLGVAATDALCLADPAALKKAPSSLPACFSFTAPPSAACWASDNAHLYVASGRKLQRYDPATNSLDDVYETESEEDLRGLAAKDKGALVVASGRSVLVIDGIQASPRIAQTLNAHTGPVEHITLSNDTSLLASTSTNAVHIDNLTMGSHTTLRGLTAYDGQHISACVFHPHARTRLLLAIAKSLIIYDITKPSTPTKTITLSDAAGGDICAMACSPFSKTLVCVATSGGMVGLVDLDKEKGLFRTINVKVPLTAVAFSPEGAAVYLGTENGKLLLVDLRALDKPPKPIVISESGSRVEALCVQKKLKNMPSAIKPSASSADAKRTANARAATATKTSPSRLRPPPRSSSASTVTTPTRKVVSSKAASPATRQTESKKVFSPVRDPLGNVTKESDDISIDLDTLTGARKNVKGVSPGKGPARPIRTSISSPKSPPARSPATRSPPQSAIDRPAFTASSRVRAMSSTSPRSVVSDATARRARAASSSSRPSSDASRPRRASAASTTESISTAGRQGPSARPRERTLSSASSRPRDRPAIATTRASTASSRPPSAISHVHRAASRTPSPELPDMGLDPVTPLPKSKRATFADLGLGSPNWAAPLIEETEPKGKGKAVDFEDDSNDEDEVEEISLEHKRLAAAAERERNLSMQVSPARRATSGLAHSPWQPSPLRRSMGPQPAAMPMPTSPGSSATAQDFLRNIVRDVMFDYQMETRQEMMGLHLDLVKMGRSWKAELRSLMDEYVGDLGELREENKRLREENERLRRGY